MSYCQPPSIKESQTKADFFERQSEANLQSFLTKLATLLHRGNGALSPVAERRDFVRSILLVVAVIVPVATLVTFTLREGLRTWDDAMPVVPIARDSWRVIYESSPAPCTARATAGCLASPDVSTLWQAPDFRDNDTHAARAKARAGQDFWIGPVVPAATVTQAAKAGANQLIIGYFNATFEVWVAGDRYTQGTYGSQKFPAMVTLPPALLDAGQPLPIAVRIVNTSGSLFPDALATNRHEGFTTPNGAEDYLMAETVENQTRPALFFGAYLVLGILALGYWTSHPIRKDFMYVGLYALFHAGLQLYNSNVTSGFMSLDANRMIRVVATVYEGGLALLFGLAWARTRHGIVRASLVVLGTLPWLILLAIGDDATALWTTAQILHKWLVPGCYALGAAACCLQAWAVYAEASKRRHLLRRGSRLVAVGVALFALGIAYWLESATAFSMTEYAAWYRLSNIAVVGFFFVIGLLDFSEMDRLVRHAPLSKYHRVGVLPQSIGGTLVNIDVKGSETLIQRGAELGQSGQFLLVCLSHMWTAISKSGGIVLQTDGDALVAFFEGDDEATTLDQAARGLLAVGHELQRLSEQFVASGVLGPDEALRIRGAMAYGEIKPVWQEVGGHRNAAWTGVGSVNLFLEAARLIELERQVGTSGHSAIVLKTTVANKLPETTRVALTWVAQGKELSGKHGKAYEISAFVVSTPIRNPLRKAG